MAIATTTTVGSAKRSSGNFVSRAFGRMVEAREKQARRFVNGYLLSLDDATLAAHGLNRDELEREGVTGTKL